MYYNILCLLWVQALAEGVPVSQVPAAESLLIHAGMARDVGRPGTPPLVPASFYVSWGEPQPGRAYVDHALEVL